MIEIKLFLNDLMLSSLYGACAVFLIGVSVLLIILTYYFSAELIKHFRGVLGDNEKLQEIKSDLSYLHGEVNELQLTKQDKRKRKK